MNHVQEILTKLVRCLWEEWVMGKSLLNEICTKGSVTGDFVQHDKISSSCLLVVRIMIQLTPSNVHSTLQLVLKHSQAQKATLPYDTLQFLSVELYVY